MNRTKCKKFWEWRNEANTETQAAERTLFLNGVIAEESWFDDDITPELFKEELFSGEGDITLWINSPGGDCIAAAQIYNMLMDYKGNVTVKIDGLAASAASVIAMAGNTVIMSPVSMMMIHNPATVVMGDHAEMQKAMDMLNEVKESIMNAYEIKTGLSRAKLSHLMDAETWMNANTAVELGFADDVSSKPSTAKNDNTAFMYSRKTASNVLLNKICKKIDAETVSKVAAIPAVSKSNTPPAPTERSVDTLMERLELIKNHL